MEEAALPLCSVWGRAIGQWQCVSATTTPYEITFPLPSRTALNCDGSAGSAVLSVLSQRCAKAVLVSFMSEQVLVGGTCCDSVLSTSCFPSRRERAPWGLSAPTTLPPPFFPSHFAAPRSWLTPLPLDVLSVYILLFTVFGKRFSEDSPDSVLCPPPPARSPRRRLGLPAPLPPPPSLPFTSLRSHLRHYVVQACLWPLLPDCPRPAARPPAPTPGRRFLL